MRRVLCLWLPEWSLQRAWRAQQGPDTPPVPAPYVLLYRQGRRGLEVARSSKRVRAAGVRRGMPLAEARSLLEHPVRTDKSTLWQAELDLPGDRAGLVAWTLPCQAFSPCVGVDDAEEPESLLLDVTGVAPLFGGEESLAEQVVALFRDAGLQARAAIAGSVGMAWAVAHGGVPLRMFPQGWRVVPPEIERRLLSVLPLTTLRLPEAIVRRLHSFDLLRVGQVLALPRETLPSRFGPQLLLRIDQALGQRPELITPEVHTTPPSVSREFDEPIPDRVALQWLLDGMLEELLRLLQPRRQGVLRLRLELSGVALDVSVVQATASLEHLKNVVALQIERWTPPGTITRLTMTAAVTAPLGFRQTSLFSALENERQAAELASLLDRLTGRLGAEAVVRPHWRSDHQPECVMDYAPISAPPPAEPVSPPPRSPRPLQLLRQPEGVQMQSLSREGGPVRFRWRNRLHAVSQQWGPERIETGWWRDQPIRRDYYRVETETGARLWLFRRLTQGDWFLQGVFG